MSLETNRFNHIGMVARWQPVHLGHAAVLRALCACADWALIGVGSSNRNDVRNPFTFEERVDMIEMVLAQQKNYTLIPVPDLDDGPRWRKMVVDLFGKCDLFVTDNPYVASLLAQDYEVIKPIELVAENERVAIDGSMVRREMAHGDHWRDMVLPQIADYITARQLDERFRREFGLQTIALDTFVKEV